MKKIMFEHRRFGLEQAVLEGRKTMTRRIAKELNHPNITDISDWGIDDKGKAMPLVTYDTGLQESVYPQYQPGETVAIAQSYRNIYEELESRHGNAAANKWWCSLYDALGKDPHEDFGYNNKMYVRSEFMPNHITISDVKFERLQDISDEDCRKEGIVPFTWRQWLEQDIDDFGPQKYKDWDVWTLPKFEESLSYNTDDPDPYEFIATEPHVAFAVLIFKLMSRKVWEQNPYVFAYEFELKR